MRWFAPVLALSLCLGVARPMAAQRYVAFGDSITWGEGDDPDRPGGVGYPARLEELLSDAGREVIVTNQGVGGEDTLQGVSRIGGALGGHDVLLLMEGTNDISREIPPESTLFNLELMARSAEVRGMKVVHATTIPRTPRARVDAENILNQRLVQRLRNRVGVERNRDLVDPFAVFSREPHRFDRLYWDYILDPVGHPNPAGYDILAQAFFDQLFGDDTEPPAPGEVFPMPFATGARPRETVTVELWDFGEGIAGDAAVLTIDGEAVEADLSDSGRRTQLSWRPGPQEAFVGLVRVGVEVVDRAGNELRGEVHRFFVEGSEPLVGDLDLDGRVDGRDLTAFARRFGTRPGSRDWNPRADLDGNELVDGEDLVLLAANFGLSVEATDEADDG